MRLSQTSLLLGWLITKFVTTIIFVSELLVRNPLQAHAASLADEFDNDQRAAENSLLHYRSRSFQKQIERSSQAAQFADPTRLSVQQLIRKCVPRGC